MAKDPKPTNEDVPEEAEPGEIPPVEDDATGEELGEVSGGGEVTDLGGDAPSS
jgi:hypothetical protein